MKKGTERSLLHHFRSAESRKATEIIRAVNDPTVNGIRIPKYVAPV